jgi:hypothetical protein
MAVVWMAHIIIYGYSQSLVGELGGGVAWPLIMITTVVTGQVLYMSYCHMCYHPPCNDSL